MNRNDQHWVHLITTLIIADRRWVYLTEFNWHCRQCSCAAGQYGTSFGTYRYTCTVCKNINITVCISIAVPSVPFTQPAQQCSSRSISRALVLGWTRKCTHIFHVQYYASGIYEDEANLSNRCSALASGKMRICRHANLRIEQCLNADGHWGFFLRI